ncbi:hypothetical protein GCM10018953_32510 [Streptosporangium nondiastaticum]|uniref:hypothetical protein n=1 Tax=Streptosporangium nondiastaticum TaxID=35764 RepID=UPI0031F9BD23
MDAGRGVAEECPGVAATDGPEVVTGVAEVMGLGLGLGVGVAEEARAAAGGARIVDSPTVAPTVNEAATRFPSMTSPFDSHRVRGCRTA